MGSGRFIGVFAVFSHAVFLNRSGWRPIFRRISMASKPDPEGFRLIVSLETLGFAEV
jgi:hypothetical protein